MPERTETLEGYVVDIACLRSYPRDETLHLARGHTRDCALMGHCVESGYGLVDDAGRVSLLDPAATPQVVEAIVRSSGERTLKLRVTREMQGEKMKTTRVGAL